jgi:NAD(P)-dependent dehydrogenase (short-subunit alcohol dehydrogenase family)
LEIAQALANVGAIVILNGRTKSYSTEQPRESLEWVVAVQLSARHFRHHEVEKAVAAFLQRHGQLDIFINNVGKRDRRK